ncbi:mucin-5AC [Drosophila guanche]|uniref:mucin-5AC n=1 Tax=Drosophila guanche TaxID=7266 RepID=UPI0014713E43|nr:mucin-5AC [Drosophila guanche]
MLGKVKGNIVVIYLTIGIAYVLVNINASSTYIGPSRQMWPVEAPPYMFYRQQPNALRKFYWYNARTPILVGKMRLKNFMRNIHMLPRYIHSPTPYHDIYGTSKRSVFRNLNTVPTTPSTTTDYSLALGPVNPFVPLTAATLPNPEFLKGVENTRIFSNYSNEGWSSICSDRISNTAARLSDDCFKNTLNRYPREEYGLNSVPNEIAQTTTTLPYMNYITHTYFTLDDVILPRSGNRFADNSAKETNEYRLSPIIITTEMPPATTTEVFQTTTRATTTTEAPIPIQTTTTFFNAEYSSSWKPITSTATTEFAQLFENYKNWTTAQTIKEKPSFQPIVTTESYNPKLILKTDKPKPILKKERARKNMTSIMLRKFKSLKLNFKNILTTKETPKYRTNKTEITSSENYNKLNETSTSVIPATIRTHLKRTFRKVRVVPSTKKTPTPVPRNTTETSTLKTKQRKTNRIFERRKHLNTTIASEPSKNVKSESESSKFKRRSTSPTTRKSKIMETTVHAPTPAHKRARNTTKVTKSNGLRSRADGIIEDKASLVTESAIMTISSGNIKLKQPILKLKSHQHSGKNINFIENDSMIPSLPIEVYFKKVNQQ